MLVIKQMWSINISVVTAQGSHLFPFRTEKLSPAAPMVLRKSGRVGRRRSLEKDISFAGILFCVVGQDRKSTRLNSSHVRISYAVFCLKKKKCSWLCS